MRLVDGFGWFARAIRPRLENRDFGTSRRETHTSGTADTGADRERCTGGRLDRNAFERPHLPINLTISPTAETIFMQQFENTLFPFRP